jgi:hypothetical protein
MDSHMANLMVNHMDKNINSHTDSHMDREATDSRGITSNQLHPNSPLLLPNEHFDHV